MIQTERCWAEVDLSALRANYADAKALCGADVMVMPVLKANAYGLGIEAVAQALDADFFAVAAYCEADRLLSARPDARVLILGLCGEEELRLSIRRGIRLTVFSRKQAEAVIAAARCEGQKAIVHVKLETGLHRIGFHTEDMEYVCGFVKDPAIDFEGLYTHLALRTAETDQHQFDMYDQCLALLEAAGARPRIRHMCDSIGMVRYPERHMDAVRTGAWLYGVCPRRCPYPEKCRPTVHFKTRISQIAMVARGECVGYDDDHPMENDCRVATLAAGYVDGYPRLNNVGEVTIRGKRARVLGLVCMDQMMVDVTDIPEAQEGDEVTLMGPGMYVDEISQWGKLNRNESLTRIGQRVPRVYID